MLVLRHTLAHRIKEIERYMSGNSEREQELLQKEIDAHDDAIRVLDQGSDIQWTIKESTPIPNVVGLIVIKRHNGTVEIGQLKNGQVWTGVGKVTMRDINKYILIPK